MILRDRSQSSCRSLRTASVDHHVYVFRKETQKAGKNIIEFYTRLQLLARKCKFTNPELEIKRQIIQGTSSVRLRRKAIEKSLSLENLLKTARAMETADEQTSEIEKQQSHAVTHGRNKPFKSSDSKPKANPRPKRDFRNTKCGLCGGNYPHQGNCPAQGKRFLKCDKMNHFSKVCRSKPKNHPRTADPSKPSPSRHHARTLDTESPSGDAISTLTSVASDGSDNSEEYTFQIDGHDPKTGKPIFSVRILDTPMRLKADSGATVNILSQKDFNSLKPKPQLFDTSTKVYPYMTAKPLDL